MAAEVKDLLRFITCGSVDDGKSTLIGRLLYESHALFDDQLAAVEADSKRWGTQAGALDLALLVDGLQAEREQGITIDVAYRFFATPRRKFIVADTPGHEQYTRNMVTGASTAELAIILVDATKGVVTQTRRHSTLVSLLGLRRVIVAINKMDLVAYDAATAERIGEEYLEFAARVGLDHVTAIPVSALGGDNVTTRSARMPWYTGPTLLEALETGEVDEARTQSGPLRLPVQWVNRPTPDFRGFSGTVATGHLRPGDAIVVQPSGHEAKVREVLGPGGALSVAVAGQSVTITLDRELDVSRGNVLSHATSPAEVADQFECTLVWMNEAPLLPGRAYLLKVATTTVNATVTEPKHKLNVNTLEHLAARTLGMNEIGVCNLSLDRPIAFDPYSVSRELGGFILIDRMTNDTVAAGMLHFALRRAHNLHLQRFEVDKQARAALKGQRPVVLWLTGLSGAGKSTIANAVERKLHALGRHAYVLDGDNVRHGLNRDLGFTAADRVENVRRVAEVAKLMVDAGLIVITALISPFRAERELARQLVEPGEFLEVFVDAPLEVAEARDVKGLYRKARAGELPNFTGIDSPYEEPEAPELRLATAERGVDELADTVIAALRERGIIAS